jgi:NAD(P)-dependent dehydrogenase (short-subunit alcohol dehydrogenase family)
MALISPRGLRPTTLTLLGFSAFVALRAAVRKARALDWTGRVVVVTGGTRGLGLLIAEEVSKRGARIAVCGRDEAAVAEAARRFAHLGGDALVHRADIGDRAQAEDFVERVISTFGRLDVLVNNAGVIQVAPLDSTPVERLEEAMRSNFWSAAYTTYAALPHLKRQRGARIVNISSIGGRAAVPHLLAYSASKFALQGFSEGLFAELRAAKIGVTTVIPAPMRTGSIYNAEFLGKTQEEFAWFGLGASLPLISVDARRAARAVVRAAENGAVEVHLGLGSKALSFVHGVAPITTQRLLALAARFLPAPGDASGVPRRGRDVDSPLAGSVLLRLSDAAAVRNNESPPAAAR